MADGAIDFFAFIRRQIVRQKRFCPVRPDPAAAQVSALQSVFLTTDQSRIRQRLIWEHVSPTTRLSVDSICR
jgi:hypothetical protein